MLSEPTFAELLAACKHSAVHLEMKDSYMPDAPTFLAWKNGFRADPADRSTWWRSFLDQISAAVSRGVVMRRARIISEPHSDYTRFLYETAFTNIAAGEEIRWLPRRRASALCLPGNDFWLFDGQIVTFNHFSGNGDVLGKELSTDPEVVKLCSASFEAVWQRAIPHDEYQPPDI